jgi:CheY-like chemotaxis protein/anti-sigma regulatory factor (Ser/Thr protein kinase)
LYADAVRLTQVFSNLLNNALKFSPPGKPVRIAAQRGEGKALIYVADEGIGIPPALLSRVFEPFVQVSGQPGENSGLGIGLTLVKRFVELHDGAVEAKSEGPGTGTTFTVELPTSSATESIAPDSSTRLSQAVNPRRILVVDDNRDAAHSLGELLKLMGHEICIAYDGQQAIELVRSAKPEVVILDIGMPYLNGYEVCTQIKQTAEQPPVVIALTGWGQDADKRRSADAGFDFHLVKPVDLNALTMLLR